MNIAVSLAGQEVKICYDVCKSVVAVRQFFIKTNGGMDNIIKTIDEFGFSKIFNGSEDLKVDVCLLEIIRDNFDKKCDQVIVVDVPPKGSKISELLGEGPYGANALLADGKREDRVSIFVKRDGRVLGHPNKEALPPGVYLVILLTLQANRQIHDGIILVVHS
ncbi:MAG: hypothetical protein LBI69_03460 [Puniceicoccales bacterium]|jgi:hypothetical protein|nr:hypothetical protein [Puniceicoccales bacterium]